MYRGSASIKQISDNALVIAGIQEQGIGGAII